MTAIGWLRERFRTFGEDQAIVGEGDPLTYAGLDRLVDDVTRHLLAAGVHPNSVVAFEGDYSRETVATLLALVEMSCVAVPFASGASGTREELEEIAGVDFLVQSGLRVESRERTEPRHPLVAGVFEADDSGLIVFSSGSTGKPKAILHSFQRLMAKYRKPRLRRRILTFLLLDHLGGINTLFYTLANGGTVVVPGSRTPHAVATAIEQHKVEILPASPTFLNLLLISGAADEHDLSSLQQITYGTEVMPQATLDRIRDRFPGVECLQTYGLSELGVLRSKSRPDGSLWFKVGGEGFETRVVDGTLRIKAGSAMLGYLNSPNPIDAEGWLDTQDVVEVDGEWIRILGRRTEMINVGGRKVFPAEVENVILRMEGVVGVAVHGEASALTGHMVVATVQLRVPEPVSEFRVRMRRFCAEVLPPFAIPQKVVLTNESLHSDRFKLIRR